MKNNDKVIILMTTYNGEKYLKKQIDSILEQSHKNWVLYIQDDNSKDNTQNIIKKYSEKYGQIISFFNETNLGPYINFFDLIGKVKRIIDYPYQYIMFADQDDIWWKDKITTMLDFMCVQSKSEVPTLVYGNMNIIDSNDKDKRVTVNDLLNLEYQNQYSIFFNHSVFGCNTIMNKTLFDFVPIPDISLPITSILAHDNYYAKYATVFGKLLYLDSSTMGYRRYGNNVTANFDYSFGFKKFFRRLFHLRKLAEDHALTYNQSLYTLNIILEDEERLLNEKERNNLKIVRNIMLKGGASSVIKFKKLNIRCGNSIRTMSRAAILLLGIYKKYINSN